MTLLVAVLLSCTPVREWNPLDYTVRAGDTLYSIAWRYETDFQDIARWNNINSPYAIYPGQRLTLTADDASGSAGRMVGDVDHSLLIESSPAMVSAATIESPVAVTETTERAELVVVQKGDSLYSLAQKNGLNHRQLARWNALLSPYALTIGQTLRLTPPGNPVVQSKAGAAEKPALVASRSNNSVATRPVVADTTKRLPAVSGWHWPVRGAVIKTFRADVTARKGIGIAGKSGQTVSAAAGGRVVYSGNGLISYGNLIIIKHDDNFLSAYAHNQSLLVAEGDEVKPDQPIARMGEENGRAQLHFEIRKNGKPVNPLQYLPQG